MTEFSHVKATVSGDGVRLDVQWRPEGFLWNKARELALSPAFHKAVDGYLAEHAKPSGQGIKLKKTSGEVRALKLKLDKLKIAKEEMLITSDANAPDLGEALTKASQEISDTEIVLEKAMITIQALAAESAAARARLEDVVGSAVDHAARQRAQEIKAGLPDLTKGFSAGDLERYGICTHAMNFLETPERYQHIAAERRATALRESGLLEAEAILVEYRKATAPPRDPFNDRQASAQPFPTKQLSSDEFDSLFKQAARVPQAEETFAEKMRLRPAGNMPLVGGHADLDDEFNAWGAGRPSQALWPR